jgi:hypothetical protein
MINLKVRFSFVGGSGQGFEVTGTNDINISVLSRHYSSVGSINLPAVVKI